MNIFVPMMKIIAKIIFFFAGWKTAGQVPDLKKYVAIAAPHTCNMDFIYGICTRFIFGIKLQYLGKKELFRFPFGFIFRALGGIPVERSSSHNLVAQVVKEFNRHERFILAMSPEGTRSYAPEWKKGFYYIAQGAGVPIVMCYLDFEKKTAGIGPVFYPTGNIEKDIEEIKNFYRGIKGKYPEKGVR